MKSCFKLFAIGCLASGTGIPANAFGADASWIAERILESGTARTCGSPPYPKFKVEVKGKTLRWEPVDAQKKDARPLSLDLSSLALDGSGRIEKAGPNDKMWAFIFDAGPGPRAIHYFEKNAACEWALIPR